jgi:hypothetical protein
MKKTMLVALISAFLAAGCAVGFVGSHRGGSMVIVPALPETVEVDADQYYYQNGYYYRYQGNVWVYSQSRQGPWSDLPRTHYPKQVRSKGHDDQGNRDQDKRDQGNRDQDKHDQDNRDHDNQQRN